MTGLPADICNQALDAIGSEVTLGDIADGSREAQVLLRAYGQCLRQLLRSANWNFAANTELMTLLADATGTNANVGSIVQNGFLYEYAYPIDCVRAREVLYLPTSTETSAPLMTGMAAPSYGIAPRRARFMLAYEKNYPAPSGQITWEIAGQSPIGRLVVLTNAPNAMMKYTAFSPYPSMWDALFRAAFVAYLAAEVALPLSKDKKFGMSVKRDQYQIAKQKVMEARVMDGNEQPMSSDISVDWIAGRMSGGGRHGRIGDGPQDGYNHDLWAGQFQAHGAFSTDFSGDFS